MSTVTPPPPAISTPTIPGPPVFYRMTVDEYERIGELLDDPRVELIDGYLVKKMPKKPEHSWTTKAVIRALEGRLPQGWTSRQEQPVRIPAHDEPEPDIAIVRGTDDDYKHRIPEPTDLGLLMEVSATNVSADRQQGDLYGRSGIPVYWIVNLVDRQVEVYSDPGPAGYASRKDFPSGQQVPVVIDGWQGGQIAVDDILP
jgi:Uma2 family endonuclease